MLKARPVLRQLVDRAAPPLADGLELYLDVADLSGEEWLARALGCLRAAHLPASFTYVVEGPLRSLDGAFFDLTRADEASRETLRRVALLGQAIGARLAVIHCIAPLAVGQLGAEEPRAVLERALPLLQYYAALCAAHGLVPTIENIPPVARMREGSYMASPIGVRPSDLVWSTERVEGLKVTLDVSHAQLYLNAACRSLPPPEPPFAGVVEALAAEPEAGDLAGYISRLGDSIANVHISNAQGLLGEGLPYAQGDIDLDGAVRRLARLACFLVTETLEPDPEQAVYMREAQRRISRALEGG